MGMKVTCKQIFLFIAIFFLTLSNSQFAIFLSINDVLEYIGYFILMAGIFFNLDSYSYKDKFKRFFITMISFSIGILVQHLDIFIKIRLVLSMLILASIAILPCKYINSIIALRTIKNALSIGIVSSTILVAIFIGPGALITGASEGIFIPYGFNGGMSHRNYYAYIVIAIIAVQFLLQKMRKKANDKISMFILTIGLLVSNSRGSYIVVAALCLILYYEKVKFYALYRKHITFFCMVALMLCIYPMYILLTRTSETFWFRTNGLQNYLDVFLEDGFHMLFGNAEMAFRAGYSYNFNIKSVIGWDGSTELVVLNVLIKNGLIGFIGYAIIFGGNFTMIKKLKNNNVRNISYAVWATFLLSAFVESYVANINLIYTTFCYLFMTNIERVDVQLREGLV